MRLFLCAALSAAVLIAAAGCGSDDSPSAPATAPAAVTATPTTSGTTTTAKAPSAAQVKAEHKAFLKKVNPICRDYNQDVRTVQSDIAAIGESGNVDVYVPPLKRAWLARRSHARLKSRAADPIPAND